MQGCTTDCSNKNQEMEGWNSETQVRHTKFDNAPSPVLSFEMDTELGVRHVNLVVLKLEENQLYKMRKRILNQKRGKHVEFVWVIATLITLVPDKP